MEHRQHRSGHSEMGPPLGAEHQPDPELLLQLYCFYAEQAVRVTEWRERANRFFVSIMSAGLAVLGFLVQQDAAQQRHLFVRAAIGLAGAVIAGLWFLTIRDFRRLNAAKFNVIHEMEKMLPYAPYTREWEFAKGGGLLQRYWGISRVEQCIPFVFFLIYVVALATGLSGLEMISVP